MPTTFSIQPSLLTWKIFFVKKDHSINYLCLFSDFGDERGGEFDDLYIEKVCVNFAVVFP